jgi:hypothetical protein
MTQAAWLFVAALAGTAGVGLLHTAWSRKQRSQAMNLAGWSLILGAAMYGATFAGAWGIAVAALFPMAGAFVLLAIAAIRSQPSKARAARSRDNARTVERSPMRLAGRGLTFVLVAVLAAAVGLGIATAAGGLVLLGGAGKSDAYATALFTMPLAWGVLAFLLLMQPHRRGQAKVLALASIPTWPCLAAGILS